MRLFVAVNLPGEIRRSVHATLQVLRTEEMDVRWTAAESLHVTVKFLGEVDTARRAAIEAVLLEAASAHSPFGITLGGVDAFPGLHRPRIWILRVRDDGALGALQRDVERLLAPLGFGAEDRPYTPHVTIGRARGRHGSTPAPPASVPDGPLDLRVPVTTMDLMKSETGAGGARYERLAAVPLAGE